MTILMYFENPILSILLAYACLATLLCLSIVMYSETLLRVWYCCVLACPKGLVQLNHRLAVLVADMQLDPRLSVFGVHNNMEGLTSFCGGIVHLVSKRLGMQRV